MYLMAQLLTMAIGIVEFIIIGQVLIHWLVNFEVINVKNQQAKNLVGLMERITEPVYSRIRKYIPPVAGMDLTPLVALIACYLAKQIIWSTATMGGPF